MKRYAVVCYEVVIGYGPLCWCGEKETVFDTAEEAKTFIERKLMSLGEKIAICDESGKLTGQYLMTIEIRNIRTLDGSGEVTHFEKP